MTLSRIAADRRRRCAHRRAGTRRRGADLPETHRVRGRRGRRVDGAQRARPAPAGPARRPGHRPRGSAPPARRWTARPARSRRPRRRATSTRRCSASSCLPARSPARPTSRRRRATPSRRPCDAARQGPRRRVGRGGRPDRARDAGTPCSPAAPSRRGDASSATVAGADVLAGPGGVALVRDTGRPARPYGHRAARGGQPGGHGLGRAGRGAALRRHPRQMSVKVIQPAGLTVGRDVAYRAPIVRGLRPGHRHRAGSTRPVRSLDVPLGGLGGDDRGAASPSGCAA